VALAAALTTLRAQAPGAGQKPRFDVVSVKENTSGAGGGLRTQAGGRFIATNVIVKRLIAAAFQMADSPDTADERILGGPDWIGTMHVDITARAGSPFVQSPDGPDPDLLLMIQSMFEDRFKMRVHHETRDLPVYELVLARADGRLGPELHQSPNDCDAIIAAVRAGGSPPARQGPADPPACGAMGGPARIIAGGLPMKQFAMRLTDTLSGTSAGRLVVDKTGLTGRFAFTLFWTPERMPASAPPAGIPPIDPNGPSFFTALQEQLGLKLQAARDPVDVIVIDSIERPTGD
jgi:uncharacterized protein (TIGR03435 family)